MKKIKKIAFVLPIALSPIITISCNKQSETINKEFSVEINKDQSIFTTKNNSKLSATIKTNIENSENFYYDWKFSSVEDFNIIENGKKTLIFIAKKEKENELVTLDVYRDSSKKEKLGSSSLKIKIISGEAPTFEVEIKQDKEEFLVDVDNQLLAITTACEGMDFLYYEWNFENENGIQIKNNGTKNILFRTSNPYSNLKVNVVVYENSTKTKILGTASKTIVIFNKKYGLNIQGRDEYTNKRYSNDAANFENITQEATNYINNYLLEDDIKNYLNLFVVNYANSFVTSRTNSVKYLIEENNIKLNLDKTISGNIKIKFTYTKKIDASLLVASRDVNDVEIHNFVFENSKIIPYINTGISNFVSYKIQTKYLQKQLISSINSSRDFNVGLKNEIIYFDDIDNLTLQLNNSLFSIQISEYLQNMYLWNCLDQEGKNLVEEVLKSILTKKAKLLVLGTNPVSNSNLASPVLEIKLSKDYSNTQNLDLFLRQISWELSSIFNFVNSLKKSTLKNGNTLYIDCTQSLTTFYDPSAKRVLDLSKSTETYYGEIFREVMSNNFYLESLEIKNRLIKNKKDTVIGSWIEYRNPLNDEQKVQLIYEYLLPYVSYGQLQRFASEIGGYIESIAKVLCEGYTHLFVYFSKILNIQSVGVTGQVKTGAVPGQTDSAGKHAWTITKVNGKWLWSDPTWDDSKSPSSDSFIKENFLKTTDLFFSIQTHLSVENWNGGKELPIESPNLQTK